MQMSQQYKAMNSQQQQAFVEGLLDLVTDGERGAAYNQARKAGMQMSAENFVEELQALIRKPEPAKGFDDIAPAPTLSKLKSPPEGTVTLSMPSEALPLPAKKAQPILQNLFDRIEDRYGSVIREKLDAAIANSIDQEICFPYEGRSKDAVLIGAVLLQETEGKLSFYDLSITKKIRASGSTDNGAHHENFSIAINFINDANEHGSITYSPLATSLDPKDYDSALKNGFKAQLDGPSWTEFMGDYSFAGNALMARLLHSSQATRVVEELSALAHKMEAHEKKELNRGALRDPDGFGKSGAAEAGSPLPKSYPLAALTGKTLEPVLQAIKPLLTEDLKLLLSTGDFARAMQVGKDLAAVGHSTNLEGDFRVVRSDVRAHARGISGRSRSGN